MNNNWNNQLFDLQYDPERSAYSLNQSGSTFNIINGVYHRIPLPLEYYIGFINNHNNCSNNNNNNGYIEYIDANGTHIDHHGFEHYLIDPFLTYFERDRFSFNPDSNDIKTDETRIKRVRFDSLTEADFEFLRDPLKRLTPLINGWDGIKHEPEGPIVVTDHDEIQILESPPFTPRYHYQHGFQHHNHHQTPYAHHNQSSIQIINQHQHNQNNHHPYKISTVRTGSKVGTSYSRGQGRKKSATGPKGYKSKSVQAPLRIAADLISRVNQTSEFVGFCGALKVNPFFSECVGRVSASKDEIGNCFFLCANCGTRRRYLPEKS